MPRRVIVCGLRPLINSPRNVIVPLVGVYRPARMLKKVVLPAPFGPIRLTIDCSAMLKSTLLTATKPPKRLVTFSATSRSVTTLGRRQQCARPALLHRVDRSLRVFHRAAQPRAADSERCLLVASASVSPVP